ncbi:hypothetical protein ACIRD2_18230 [Streptomyces sp. NPDC093595]|uniref:hypothetical protein n=1 Tax=Streptomyces sp. NPDC093595 TaxID=3366045 RepID=UPI0037FF8D75
MRTTRTAPAALPAAAALTVTAAGRGGWGRRPVLTGPAPVAGKGAPAPGAPTARGTR